MNIAQTIAENHKQASKLADAHDATMTEVSQILVASYAGVFHELYTFKDGSALIHFLQSGTIREATQAELNRYQPFMR